MIGSDYYQIGLDQNQISTCLMTFSKLLTFSTEWWWTFPGLSTPLQAAGLAQLEKQLRRLLQVTTAREKGVEDRLVLLEGLVGGCLTREAELTKEVGALRERLADLELQMDELNVRLKDAETSPTTILSNLANLGSDREKLAVLLSLSITLLINFSNVYLAGAVKGLRYSSVWAARQACDLATLLLQRRKQVLAAGSAVLRQLALVLIHLLTITTTTNSTSSTTSTQASSSWMFSF